MPQQQKSLRVQRTTNCCDPHKKSRIVVRPSALSFVPLLCCCRVPPQRPRSQTIPRESLDSLAKSGESRRLISSGGAKDPLDRTSAEGRAQSETPFSVTPPPPPPAPGQTEGKTIPLNGTALISRVDLQSSMQRHGACQSTSGAKLQVSPGRGSRTKERLLCPLGVLCRSPFRAPFLRRVSLLGRRNSTCPGGIPTLRDETPTGSGNASSAAQQLVLSRCLGGAVRGQR